LSLLKFGWLATYLRACWHVFRTKHEGGKIMLEQHIHPMNPSQVVFGGRLQAGETI